eukprot:TRINITY_DN558_c0_g1_i4.p1 TRINITY_DN558_c0_g1~~TRINITY_DN558_c0_g1_i4.p1  ORF type:complete len:380 (-),score=70.72 TRINITY_DN558_c0_g1_i4:122-1261(-)
MMNTRPPSKFPPRGMGYSIDEDDGLNHDPGVNEPEDRKPQSSGYPDTQDFIAQFMKASAEDPNPTYPLPPQQQQQTPIITQQTMPSSPVPMNSMPNGMIMVPANQMMMLAPQWMFNAQKQHLQPQPQLAQPLSAPMTPEPAPPTPEPTPSVMEMMASPNVSNNNYKGLGGPDSVTFRMKQHPNEDPNQTKKKTLMDELFISPSEDQRLRSSRTVTNAEIAQTKSRLKWSILFHYVLGFILLAKLVPDGLDRLGIFVLEIEELMIPKAQLWELCWIISIPLTFLGLASCKKSNASMMTKFFYGIFIFGLFPVLVGFFYNFSDVLSYVSNKDLDKVETWNGLPVGVLRYVYLFLTLQAHLFELYFAKTLIQTWQPKGKKIQ